MKIYAKDGVKMAGKKTKNKNQKGKKADALKPKNKKDLVPVRASDARGHFGGIRRHTESAGYPIKIAVVDTMFARGDMATPAVSTMRAIADENGWPAKFVRVTVPGVKDLPVALLQLLEQGCFAGIVFGMPGSAPVDKTCSHEASLGIQEVQLMTRKTALEVFVHEDEARDSDELGRIMHNRATKHALNLMHMIFRPEELSKKAGSGERQGKENAPCVKVAP